MNKLFRKLRTIIMRDTGGDTEAKDLTVLLRILSLIYTLYYIFVAIALAVLYHYAYAFVALVCVGLLGACFIFTYDNRTPLSYRLFNMVTVVSISIFTLSTGWWMNFQWHLLLSMLILFYSVEIEMSTKMRNMKILLTIFIALAVFTHLAPSYREGSTLYFFVFQTLQTMFYGAFFGIVAYFYCNKFNMSEKRLRQSNQKLTEMASIDALTKLPNRRNMNEHLSVLVYENDRTGKPFCIAIGDVDFFKRVNDNYGHDTGDYVLVTLSEMFRNIVKGRGKVARWGGEEFLFCFENMNIKQVYATLEVLRMQIEKTNFTFKEHNLRLTMTFGLEEYSQIVGVESTIYKADAKLYEGKEGGRNRVVY